MTAISIEPLTSAVGGEVHDIDVERLRDDDELPAAVLEALEQVGVLVFPDLHVDPQTQVAFCPKLGGLLHRVRRYDTSKPREMPRTTVLGEEPISSSEPRRRT